jgi:hypothetical protein
MPMHDTPPADEDAGAGQDALEREPYLRQALDALERGQLDVSQYAQRVRAIHAAGSTDLMEAIVAEGAVTVADGTTPVSMTGATAAGGLDPVDLARMQRQHKAPSTVNGRRYLTLAVVVVLFAVLLGVGVYLASHVHTITSGVHHLATGARAGGRDAAGVLGH